MSSTFTARYVDKATAVSYIGDASKKPEQGWYMIPNSEKDQRCNIWHIDESLTAWQLDNSIPAYLKEKPRGVNRTLEV